MKMLRWVGGPCVVALLMSGNAMAACSGNSLSQTELSSALTGKTVCARRGNDRWQEYHQSGGTLIDYKKGPNDKVDPSSRVGTWEIVASGNGLANGLGNGNGVGNGLGNGIGNGNGNGKGKGIGNANANNAVVRYTYGKSTQDYKVYSTATPGIYSFCEGNSELSVTIISGQHACP